MTACENTKVIEVAKGRGICGFKMTKSTSEEWVGRKIPPGKPVLLLHPFEIVREIAGEVDRQEVACREDHGEVRRDVDLHAAALGHRYVEQVPAGGTIGGDEVEVVARDADAFGEDGGPEPDEGPGDVLERKDRLVSRHVGEPRVGLLLDGHASGHHPREGALHPDRVEEVL